ncbi:MAG: glycosyltransferase [Candidatus Levybacteria bacterium]|nr:glycosyltransferase [Candidatus Levybacteria bacterium]
MNTNSKAETIKMDMRKLWEDHITWTRAYLISAAADSAQKDADTKRLLKNQEDIGNAIKPYYGEAAGGKLTMLLKEHIATAVDLVTAAKANDQAAMNAANNKWYKNANDIADFLAAANPNWPKDQARAMMKEHLDLTKQEAADILGGKYEENVTDYDKVHAQILKMADMLSAGILKQFPEKF